MIILITGASGSGKSTIASNVAKMINAVIVPQDSFYKVKFDNYPFDKDVDVEGKDIIDWPKIGEVIKRIDMATNTNIVVEGHLVATNGRLLRYADVVVLIDSPYHLVKKRFMNRYSDNYSIEQLDQKEKYFDEKTWPAYEQYQTDYLNKIKGCEKVITIKPDIDKGTEQILEFINENELG